MSAEPDSTGTSAEDDARLVAERVAAGRPIPAEVVRQ
jgi:hypothetical protein